MEAMSHTLLLPDTLVKNRKIKIYTSLPQIYYTRGCDVYIVYNGNCRKGLRYFYSANVEKVITPILDILLTNPEHFIAGENL